MQPESGRVWVERITLTNFRNYPSLSLNVTSGSVVLVGPNGAGKTNLLEAVSLLSAGQGLRRAGFAELGRAGRDDNDGSWAVAAHVHTRLGALDIGSGLAPPTGGPGQRASGRTVVIAGENRGSGALAEYIDMAWVTPAMDGLFTGPASERRRFLDRMILNFDPGYRTSAAHYERAMTGRNKLLAQDVRDGAQFSALERVMAENGVAIAAARLAAVEAVSDVIGRRRLRDAADPFPWAGIALEGNLEAALGTLPAVDVEDRFLRTLANGRERDRAAGRTLDGPHRSDLAVTHGPKAMAARLCSTGEQKSLLVGLILAQAEMLAERHGGHGPILLLDEITAHLDADRRAALFREIARLDVQAWMTGTDAQAFAAIEKPAQIFTIGDGSVRPI